MPAWTIPGSLLQAAADRCGMAYRTLLAIVRRGELPAEKPDGRPYRVRRPDVDAFIELSRVKPGEVKAAPRCLGTSGWCWPGAYWSGARRVAPPGNRLFGRR